MPSDALDFALSRAVRAERARARLSQAELATRIGTSQTRVAAIENGTRRVYASELPALCAALEVTLAELLSRATRADLDALGL